MLVSAARARSGVLEQRPVIVEADAVPRGRPDQAVILDEYRLALDQRADGDRHHIDPGGRRQSHEKCGALSAKAERRELPRCRGGGREGLRFVHENLGPSIPTRALLE